MCFFASHIQQVGCSRVFTYFGTPSHGFRGKRVVDSRDDHDAGRGVPLRTLLVGELRRRPAQRQQKSIGEEADPQWFVRIGRRRRRVHRRAQRGAGEHARAQRERHHRHLHAVARAEDRRAVRPLHLLRCAITAHGGRQKHAPTRGPGGGALAARRGKVRGGTPSRRGPRVPPPAAGGWYVARRAPRSQTASSMGASRCHCRRRSRPWCRRRRPWSPGSAAPTSHVASWAYQPALRWAAPSHRRALPLAGRPLDYEA